METYQIEIIEPKAKRLIEELVNLNLIKFRPIETNGHTAAPASELRALFAATQALPQARSISEEEIAAEVATYREGK